MTDYKTAYETLAAAAREVRTRLGDTRWNPTGNISDWTETPEGLNHGCVIDARAILERALAQAPVGGETRDMRPFDPTAENAAGYYERTGLRLLGALTPAGEVAVAKIRAERLAKLQPTDGHGNPDPGGKYWLAERGDLPGVPLSPDSAAELDVDQSMERSMLGTSKQQAGDAEREHCERVVQANDIAQLLFYHENTDERPEPWEEILLRERADAAKRATEAAQVEINRLHDEVTDLLAERDGARNRATEVERERCLAVLTLGMDGTPGWFSNVHERIASGLK